MKVWFNTASKESACKEYIMCLVLLLANNVRFATLKTNLDNNSLMGKQEYPTDILSVKRLMTNYVPTGGLTKPRQ